MTPRLPERLEHAGLVLVRWRPGDEVELSELVALSRDHLIAWMDFAREEPGPPELHAPVLLAWDQEWREGAGVSYRILDDDAAACGVVTGFVERAERTFHVGYWLAPWATGRGRVSRAVAAVTSVALARDDVDAVVIRHDAHNERSEAVPRRLGFHRCRAETRDARLPGDSGVTVHWEARRGEWRPPSPDDASSPYDEKSPTGQATPVPPSPQ